jgi:P27 family predicted phage terminase small subunit
MARGRKPKPPGLDALQGNPSKRAPKDLKDARQDRPVAPPVDRKRSHVAPPKWLAADARAIWAIVAPELQRMQFLGAADAIAFGRYCQWLARYLELEKATRKAKVVKTTRSRAVTMERIAKSFQVLTVIDKQLRDYEDRFGMNPRERTAIFGRLAGNYSPAPRGSGEDPAPKPPEKAGDVPVVTPRAPASPIGFLSGGTKH